MANNAKTKEVKLMETTARAVNENTEQSTFNGRVTPLNDNWDNVQVALAPILTAPDNLRNAWLAPLVNRIGLTKIRSLVKNNDFAELKKDSMPFGSTVQEIYTNPAIRHDYCVDGDTDNPFKIFKPDTKAAYHVIDRQALFAYTVSDVELKKAFTSFAEFMRFINSLANTLYSGNAIDEMQSTQAIIEGAYNAGHIKRVGCGSLTDDPVDLVRAIKQTSLRMEIPSSNLNAYLFAQTEDTQPVVTWTPRNKQVIFLNANASTSVDVDVLANAFNMEKANIIRRQFNVAEWNLENVYGFMGDEAFFQIYDVDLATTVQENPACRTRTVFLHSHSIYSYSVFSNFVALTNDPYNNGEILDPITPTP